jgi:predicted ABC-type ATPase
MQPTPRKPEQPVLWLIAGPNGCGKSSFYNHTDIEGWGGSVWIINPDLLTQRIVEQEGLDVAAANLQAVQRIETWLFDSLDVHQTVGVETVLSTGKYRPLVAQAKVRGFEVRLVYVLVRNADIQVERIRLRVAEGGHHVPEEKTRARRERSFRQLVWFLEQADRAWVYDNSTAEPELLMEKRGDALLVLSNRLPGDLIAIFEAEAITLRPPA